jgi:hypothetical protein
MSEEGITGSWQEMMLKSGAGTVTHAQPVAAAHKPLVDARFERIAIDLAAPFPQSDQGDRYVVIAIDHFTKGPGRRPTPSPT